MRNKPGDILKNPIPHQALAAALHTAVDLMIIIDSKGNIKYANQAAQRSLKDTSGNITANMPQNFRGPHQQALEKLRTGGLPKLLGQLTEVCALDKVGNEVPYHLALQGYKQNGDQYYFGTLRPLEQHKRLLEQQRAEQQLVNRIFEQLDPAVNKLTQQLASWQDTQATSTEEATKAIGEMEFISIVRSHYPDGDPLHAITQQLTPLKEFFSKIQEIKETINNNVQAVEAGQVLLKQAEREKTPQEQPASSSGESVKTSELEDEILLQALETTIDPIIIINEDGDIVYTNKAARESLKNPTGNITESMPTRFQEAHRQALGNLKPGGHPKGTTYDVTFLNQENVETKGALSLHRFQHDNETYYFGNLRDIHEDKQLSDQIELFMTLAGRVFHDLRSPLTTLLALYESLATEKAQAAIQAFQNIEATIIPHNFNPYDDIRRNVQPIQDFLSSLDEDTLNTAIRASHAMGNILQEAKYILARCCSYAEAQYENIAVIELLKEVHTRKQDKSKSNGVTVTLAEDPITQPTILISDPLS